MSESKVVVLYRISNSKESTSTPFYNAFEIPRRGDGSVTLGQVKQHCKALRFISHLGADGYHWRVRVEDRPSAAQQNQSNKAGFSWWDIKDENARLPVKNMTASELERTFMKSSSESTIEQSVRTVANTASGAFSRFNKAMNAVADGVSSTSVPSRTRNDESEANQPRISVIAFKLLDLVKLNDDFGAKQPESRQRQTSKHTSSAPIQHKVPLISPQAPSVPKPTPRPQPPRQAQPSQSRPTTLPSRVTPPARPTQTQTTPNTLRPPPTARTRSAETSLLDFSDTPAKPVYRQSVSMPVQSNLTRAEKLKHQYEQKAKTQNRVWDEVDQRWVAVESGAVKKGSTSTPPTAASTQKQKIKGISIDASNAIGKSSNVQAAVNQRVNELKTAQTKAVAELKEREAQKKASEEEEDAVRKRLESKIKAWSEEHGKKKQLRALLASLHLILWPECNWKQVSLGDILDEKKARRCYLKATLKVHPDKTRDLDAEKKFIAKRVFDALSQAMKEFDNAS